MKSKRTMIFIAVLAVLLAVAPAHAFTTQTLDVNAGESAWLVFDANTSIADINAMTMYWTWTNWDTR
jgi:hypothetical protein